MSWNISIPDAKWYTSETPSDQINALVREVAHQKVVGIDTETTGLDNMKDIVLYWSLSWARPNGEKTRVCLRADLLPHFKKLFTDRDRSWVFCNAKYDTHILANSGIDIDGRLVDVSVMHALLYEEAPHGLKPMMQQIFGWRWRSFEDIFGRPNTRDPNDSIQARLIRSEKENLDMLVDYASNDAYGALELYYKLKEELEAARTWSLYSSTCKLPKRYDLCIDSLWDLFSQVEVPFTRVLWKCERNGLKVDTEYLKNIEGPVRKKLDELGREMTRIAGRPINPNSPKQLQDYFYGDLGVGLGLSPKRLTKGGKTGVRVPTTDYETLVEFAADGIEFAKVLLEHRELDKLLGTYVVGLQAALDRNGRVHTHFNQDVARTGRLSSSGPNLQNIPRPDDDKFKIRKAFTCERGNRLIVADYEQLEMRLLASAAREKDMIDIFLRNWDIHMGNASLVFGIPYDDLKKAKAVDKAVKEGKADPKEMTDYVVRCLDARQAAKAIGFGLNYGMKENKLARSINKTPEEAARLIEQYMGRYPAVRHFYDEAINTVKETGYAFTLLGRRRFLPEILSARNDERWRAERQASNVPIQGTAADVAKMAMIRIDQENLDDKYGWYMLSQIHDEIVCEGAEETCEEVLPIIKHCMEHSLPTDLDVPLDVAAGRGVNWLEAK